MGSFGRNQGRSAEGYALGSLTLGVPSQRPFWLHFGLTLWTKRQLHTIYIDWES